jgi:hypothetical protein
MVDVDILAESTRDWTSGMNSERLVLAGKLPLKFAIRLAGRRISIDDLAERQISRSSI